MSREQTKGGTETSRDPAAVQYEQSVSAWQAIEAFASSGKGSEIDLPKHMAALGDSNAGAIAKMSDIAKHATGDIVLECAGVLRMPVTDSVALALKSSTRVTAGPLREFLRRYDPGALAAIGDKPALIDGIRKLLKGPLGVELPALESLPEEVHRKPRLVEWFVETTNPTVAAMVLTSSPDEKLVTSLDSIAATTPKAWSWLDHLHVMASAMVGPGVIRLRDNTGNVDAKAKLERLAASYQTDANQRDKDQTLSEPRFNRTIAEHDDAAFLDAAARTQGSNDVNRANVPARLAGRSADTVLEYLFTLTPVTSEGVAETIEILRSAVGVTREHVLRVFSVCGSDNIVGALKKDATRKHVRQMIGRDAGLGDIFSHDKLEAVHPLIIADEALRQWAYEDSSPRNLLWVAVGSAAGAKLGCRIVANERGNEWLKKVPRDVPQAQVRRFVLSSTDVAAVTWVKSNLLHDQPHKTDLEENNPHSTSSYVYGNAADIRPKILSSAGETELVSERLADLAPADRAKVLADKEGLVKIFAAERGNELRTVELLAPTLVELTRLPIHEVSALVDYTVTRPAGEQLAAAREASAAQQVLGHISPLMTFPALRQPALLAKALADNSELLAWILQETDTSQALAVLSREPARQVVAQLIEADGKILEGLPSYALLRKAGRAGFDAIAKDLHDADAKQTAADYQAGELETSKEASDRAGHVAEAVSYGNLAANIKKVIETGGTRADVIAVVQAATPAQQMDLLSAHPETVRDLRNHIHLGPQHVFPDLSLAQLLAMRSTAEWLVSPVAGGQHAPLTVLHLLGQDRNAAAALADNFRHDFDLAQRFISALPKGAALTDAERLAMDELAKHIKYDILLRMLFVVRFDVEIGFTYDTAETHRVWSVLKRLPSAQVNQNVIKHFTEKSIGGPSGQWASPDIEMEIDPAERDKEDNHYEDREIEMTADEVKKAYGLDDKGLALASNPDSGWLKTTNGKYTVKPVVGAKVFDNTVIHEVGHSVDALLGDHTELVFSNGFAGWSEFGYDQFEKWASEMGAFDGMTAPERAKVVEVWQHSLRSKTAVSKLVDKDHPAIAHKQSPLAKFVDRSNPFKHTDASLEPVNGRVFLQTEKALASVTNRAWEAAPTNYAMTAPAEWFAECYVEYYRDYDGTQGTEANKGGKLPNWIKQWFAQHVDKIRFSPHRVLTGIDKP